VTNLVKNFAAEDAPTQEQLLQVAVHTPAVSLLEKPVKLWSARATSAASTLGLNTVADLLDHLPFRHEDRSTAVQVAMLSNGSDATLNVRVVQATKRRGWRNRKMMIVEAMVEDETGSVKAVWFNQPWLADRLKPGVRLSVHGRYNGSRGFSVSEYQFVGGDQVPERQVSSGSSEGELVPVYSSTEGLSPQKLRELITSVKDLSSEIIEYLPSRLIAKLKLADRSDAVKAMHSPANVDAFRQARRRLAFDELFTAQMALLVSRSSSTESEATKLAKPGEEVDRWLTETVPFELTDDQKRVITEIDEDLCSDRPMQRLLMGEVGSGKTVLALYTMLRAVENGCQAVLMAPTETLAQQHFATLEKLLPGELMPFALLTGSTTKSKRADILAHLATGALKMVVGTHALIEDNVQFDRLTVAVVDEQHRFGVKQRAALDSKGFEGSVPHRLHMTATPIPRTLALTMYGDLDVSVLKGLPKGRMPIDTYVASSERERSRAYERIREELALGRQAFVVCPLVEESDELQARAATVEYQRLKEGEFKQHEVVLLHGQMPAQQKSENMKKFASGQADVLVATSVIEVGVDIPNATVMLVEDADRYGISQLHQLRGRIGRGEHKSLCLLFGSKSSRRLRALAEHSDGFKLAEIDLDLRGEGEIVGTKQSGLPQFRVAKLPQDIELLDLAREQAERIVSVDPQLIDPKNRLIMDRLQRVHGTQVKQLISA